MSLAAADKLLKVFDALKNFREGIPAADPNPLAKKKESLLSKKDRILLLNTIPELTCSPSIRNLGEFPKILSIAVDTLLISCDDGESDVRFVAGECLNKLIKGSMDTSLGRIHVELYKEIKKNGPARSLRAALSRFGDLCHLIRPQKCRPFIANLLPCIARVSLRTEDAIQETLANAMQKIMGVLGSFTSEAEVKQLLKTFLPNLRSSSAITRRTAASSLAVICCHSRKPNFVSEWLLNILLGMVLPFQESRDSNVYLGVLICLRHMIPNLDKSSPNEHNLKGLRGSFGTQRSYSGDGPQHDKDVKSTQLLQAYEVIMYCTKHQNHNVVTASLETLLQLLRTPPPLLLSVLLSSEGITPSASTETFKGGMEIFEEIASEGDSVVDESDTASITESTVSTVDTGIGSSVANDFDGEQITADEMLQSPELDHLRLHGDSITSDAEGLREVDEGDLFLSSSMQGDLDNRQLIWSLSDPGHMVDGQDVANVDNALNEPQDSIDTGESIFQKDANSAEGEQNEDDIMGTGSISSDEVRQLVQRSFQIDSVACSGIPLLHCARLMCSFLLSGNPGEMLSDSSVRVSVKSLALLCIAQVVRLHPEAFLARMLPESSSESDEEGLHRSSPQLVRDVLLFSGHGDPQLRGSLAAVIGNVIRSGLEMGRLDFDMWCIDNCQELETVPLVLEDLISALKTILQDESSIAIRQACISLKSCLSLLCSSKHSRVALDLLDAILSLHNNSYWLVKVELLEILEDVDFRQLMFLTNKLKHQSPKRHRLFKDSLQDAVLDKVLFHLLEDDDIRVRQAAAKCFVSLVPRFFFSLNNDVHSVIISAAQSQISCLSIQDPHYRTHNQAVINSNLSRVVLLVTSRLNHATSRTTMLGCVHLLSLLAETFPVTSYPDAWGCGVSISCSSPLPTHPIGSFSTPSRPSSPSASCTGGGGPLSVAVGSMISSWLAYDLFAHQQLLKISGRLLFGAGCSGVHASLEHHSEQGSHDEPNSSAENWSVFTDSALAPQAEKLIYHLVRLLNILTHVIDNVVPGALPFKLTFPGQNKDKQTAAAIPGVAAPQVTGSSSAGSNLASAGPKRILTKSKRALSEADLHQAITAEKPTSPSKSQASVGPSSDGEQMTHGPPPKSAIGAFHHLPHYMKLYEITKGAFANNQVSLVDPSQDKFCQFLSATLESLSLLLEVTAFSDIGKHVEEILGYLQVCIKLEATKTILCVQQLLRTMFGINALCQPILVHNPVVPPCLAESNIAVPPPSEHLPSVDEQLYHSCFVHPLSLIAQTLDRLKPKEESKDKAVEVLSGIGLFIKKLKKKSSSSFVRPKMKLDKQSPIHSFIRWFEPLVIRALKEYTLSSSITLQQQVLSLLTQLIKLRVNYSLLDADQLFISFVQKQFEYIDAGQIKSCDTFLPHIFQFLVLLSYECFQPKFHEPKAIVGMPRIIQLCDGIMAGGQPPQTHAIPALQPIIYDLFVLRTAGKSDGGQCLETQREVVLSMLLRLVHYPEVLEMLVTVVNCYQRDEVKWKSFSGQIIDLLLPLLANQKVHLESEYGIEMLQNLFTAVAPGSLWPVDVLLRVLFCDVDQMPSDLFSRWLATTLVVLQTLMAYVSEDILLSRIDQSGFRPSCANKPGTQLLPIEVFVKFLFHVVEVTASRIAMIERSAENPPSQEIFIFKLFSLTLTCLTHLLKSANFKKVSQLASSSALIQPSLEITKECVSNLVDTRPAVVLLWCQVLRHVKYTDDYFWCGFIDSGTRLSTASTTNIEQDGPTLNKHITRLGVVLIYCDLLIAQQLDRGVLNLSQAGTILKLSLEDLITMCREPPVQEFLSLLCSTPEGSKLLLDSVSSCRSLPEAMKQPSFMCDLLFCLRTVHASQTLHFIRILVEMYFNSCHVWVVQMAEREIRKKLEMLSCGGQNKESSQDLGEDELRSVCHLIASTERAKRNSSLMSMVNKILQSSSSYVDREMPGNEDLASAMDNYTVDREWFRRLAEQRCFASLPGDPQTKSVPPQEAAKMLSVLNASEVSDVMNRADFDISLLEQCILRGIEGTLLLSARRQNPEEAASDPYDFTETAESIDIDNLLLVSKLSLFSRIEEIVKDVIRTRSFRDSESSTKISCFCLAVEQLSTLCNDATWCRKVTCLARALVALASAIPTLPKYFDIPESGRQSLFHFVFIPLAVVHHNFLHGKRPCSTVLTSHLECLAKFLNLECCKSIGRMEYFPLVSSAIDHVHVLLNGVCGDDTMEESCFGNGAAEPDVSDEGIDLGRKACSKISVMVHRLLAMTKPGSLERTSIPQFLVGPFRGVVLGLARQPLVNSYARCPPLVWKLGWDPAPEGPLKTELPPIPIEILKEKDVLDEFVRVVNFIGWTSRQQFEETWAALLGVISSPPLPDTVSIEEDMESTHSCCLAVRCISELLLQTTLYPVPGNPTVSSYLHRPRHRDLPFLGSRAGKKLTLVRGVVEEEFAAMCCTGAGRPFISDEETKPGRSASINRANSFTSLNNSSRLWLTNRMLFDHPLYGLNIDRVLGFHEYTLGQISVGALYYQAQNDLHDHSDSDDDTAIVVSLPRMPQPEKLDIKSCEQFLLELFEQWMSLYIQPKTPLALMSEATKALLVLSDLFVDGHHFEWVLETLLELHHNHSGDDLLIQYLLPTLCKAAAFLKTEGVIAEKVCTILESSLRSPHVPLQISALYGAMYLLEFHVASVSVVLLPILTEFLSKKLVTPGGAVSFAEHHLLVMWSTAFYLLEKNADEISDQEFKANILKSAVSVASSNEDSTPTCVYHAVMRGLERLVVSFALSSAESDSLVKLSVDRLSMQNPQRAISALGLLVTCMYTGKIGDRVSGIYPQTDAVELPTEDRLLVAMERVTVLFDRIRKGISSEAKVVARVLPALLLDFFPAQEIMNKVIGEFLSSQQPHPELIAQVLFKVFEGLHNQGLQTEVRDWVLLSLGSFVQRTPLSMAVWSLSCFFVSASNNKWIRALFSLIVGRMGRLQSLDVKLFCATALDFFRNQNLDSTSKEIYVSTFSKAAATSAPYRELLECCLSET